MAARATEILNKLTVGWTRFKEEQGDAQRLLVMASGAPNAATRHVPVRILTPGDAPMGTDSHRAISNTLLLGAGSSIHEIQPQGPMPSG